MTSGMEQRHTIEMQVRDYELDLQGIVNNGVYFNYLEHARHQYFLEKGIDFEKLFKEGIAAMVMKAEINYKKSLRSRDRFVVETYTSRKGRFKVLFHQVIRPLSGPENCVEAVITGVCMNINTKRPVEVEW